MTRDIVESEMHFGPYDEQDLFHIEKASLYKNLGEGIKTVEFVLRYREKSICFVEAKRSMPNAENRQETEEKTEKFEAFYNAIAEKFLNSLQIYLAAVLKRYGSTEELGQQLQNPEILKSTRLRFVLVVKTANESWLPGSCAELNTRILAVRKIWDAKVVVLNEAMARKYGIVR